MQKHFIAKDGYDALQCKEAGEWDEWEWFYDHVEKVVIPNNKRLLDCCRKNGVEVTYGRIASLKKTALTVPVSRAPLAGTIFTSM